METCFISGDQIDIGVHMEITECVACSKTCQEKCIQEIDVGTLDDQWTSRTINASRALIEQGKYDEFMCLIVQFNTGEFERLLKDQQFLVLYLKFKLQRGRYSDIFQILQSLEHATEPDLVKIWDETICCSEIKKRGKPLTSVQRCKLRKRFPPPPGICINGVRSGLRIPEEQRRVLSTWFDTHSMYPYPSKQVKTQLAAEASLTLEQVSTWFANMRRRLKTKGVVTKGKPRTHITDQVNKQICDTESASEEEMTSVTNRPSKSVTNRPTKSVTNRPTKSDENMIETNTVPHLSIDTEGKSSDCTNETLTLKPGDTVLYNGQTFIVYSIENVSADEDIPHDQKQTTRDGDWSNTSTIENTDAGVSMQDQSNQVRARSPLHDTSNSHSDNTSVRPYNRKCTVYKMSEQNTTETSSEVCNRLKDRLTNMSTGRKNKRGLSQSQVNLRQEKENMSPKAASDLAVAKRLRTYGDQNTEPLDLTMNPNHTDTCFNFPPQRSEEDSACGYSDRANIVDRAETCFSETPSNSCEYRLHSDRETQTSVYNLSVYTTDIHAGYRNESAAVRHTQPIPLEEAYLNTMNDHETTYLDLSNHVNNSIDYSSSTGDQMQTGVGNCQTSLTQSDRQEWYGNELMLRQGHARQASVDMDATGTYCGTRQASVNTEGPADQVTATCKHGYYSLSAKSADITEDPGCYSYTRVAGQSTQSDSTETNSEQSGYRTVVGEAIRGLLKLRSSPNPP